MLSSAPTLVGLVQTYFVPETVFVPGYVKLVLVVLVPVVLDVIVPEPVINGFIVMVAEPDKLEEVQPFASVTDVKPYVVVEAGLTGILDPEI